MGTRILDCVDGSRWVVELIPSNAGMRVEARAMGAIQATVGRTGHGWYFGGKLSPLELPAQVIDAVGADWMAARREGIR